MARNNRKLVLAMEDEMAASSQVSVDANELEALQAAGENELMANELETDTETVSELAESAGQLERVQETIQSSVDSNTPMTPNEVQYATIAVEAAISRFGIGKKKIPAMESFKSKHTSMAATRLALESVGDTIKKAWDGFIAMMKKVLAKLKEWARKVFGDGPGGIFKNDLTEEETKAVEENKEDLKLGDGDESQNVTEGDKTVEGILAFYDHLEENLQHSPDLINSKVETSTWADEQLKRVDDFLEKNCEEKAGDVYIFKGGDDETLVSVKSTVIDGTEVKQLSLQPKTKDITISAHAGVTTIKEATKRINEAHKNAIEAEAMQSECEKKVKALESVSNEERAKPEHAHDLSTTRGLVAYFANLRMGYSKAAAELHKLRKRIGTKAKQSVDNKSKK